MRMPACPSRSFLFLTDGMTCREIKNYYYVRLRANFKKELNFNVSLSDKNGKEGSK